MKKLSRDWLITVLALLCATLAQPVLAGPVMPTQFAVGLAGHPSESQIVTLCGYTECAPRTPIAAGTGFSDSVGGVFYGRDYNTNTLYTLSPTTGALLSTGNIATPNDAYQYDCAAWGTGIACGYTNATNGQSGIYFVNTDGSLTSFMPLPGVTGVARFGTRLFAGLGDQKLVVEITNYLTGAYTTLFSMPEPVGGLATRPNQSNPGQPELLVQQRYNTIAFRDQIGNVTGNSIMLSPNIFNFAGSFSEINADTPEPGSLGLLTFGIVLLAWGRGHLGRA